MRGATTSGDLSTSGGELRRNPVNGKLTIVASPGQHGEAWSAVVGLLVEGLHAAARGQELPDLPSPPPKAAQAKKTKKR